MFTGIVEETGTIKAFHKNTNGASIEIGCSKVLDGTKTGDSIAINGCCQTVTKLQNSCFCANVSDETLSVTTFDLLKIGQEVNLERALTPNSRLGGHIVSGHIDCTGKLMYCEQLTDFYNLTFEIPADYSRYIVKKGSITIDGISLTVAEIDKNTFKCAIIPHTYQNTTLKNLKCGEFVNIETDILGKYVEKFLSAKDNKGDSIDLKFLQESGFV